ncbi:MAG: sulfur carrier protein ThiS [Pyrinomonadaceae bacterium]
MRVIVNSEMREIPVGFSVQQLVEHLLLPLERTAIERNLEVVRRTDWSRVQLSEGDKIEIVHFVGGG